MYFNKLSDPPIILTQFQSREEKLSSINVKTSSSSSSTSSSTSSSQRSTPQPPPVPPTGAPGAESKPVPFVASTTASQTVSGVDEASFFLLRGRRTHAHARKCARMLMHAPTSTHTPCAHTMCTNQMCKHGLARIRTHAHASRIRMRTHACARKYSHLTTRTRTPVPTRL